MAAPQEADVAAKLIERLLMDPAFRVTFRRDPAAACREAGLDSLAEEMALGAGKAMMTLDVRESKSSLAGVMMAAAMEGVGLYQFSENVLPHIEDIPGQVGDVLSRVNLPSIRGALSGGGGGSSADAAALADAGGGGAGAGGAGATDAAANGVGGGSGAAAAAPAAPPPPPPAPPEAPPEAAAGKAAGGGAKAGAAAAAPPEATAKPPEASAAQKAADKIAAAENPKAKAASSLDDLASSSSDVPSSGALPEGEVPTAPAEEIGPGGAKVPDATNPPAPGAAAAPAAAAPAAPAGTPGAGAVVDAGAVGPAGGGGSPLGDAALRIAQTQRGVREIGGANMGPQVDQYLAAAGVPPGNPWCASFVTWSLQQAGHKMPGGGWGGVVTWVRNAEQGSNGLRIVSAADARPGDIVAYDWGGQNDFGSDGHIGFLQSTVQGDQFTALEGNNADAVNVVPRHLGGGPNVVFIRAEGNAPGGAPAAPVASGPAPVAAAASAAPAGPAAAPAPAPSNQDSIQFKAVTAQEASKRRATMQFMAAKPSDAAAAAAAPPAGAPAAAAAAAPPEAAGAPGSADLAASSFSGGPATYPGDNAPKAQIAAWMAAEAQKRGLPPELPVMASLVESGVKNLNYGDADSVGFFQMRVGTWNQGAYEGFPQDPQKQINWFLDQAEAVKKQRISRGQSVTDPNQYGNWIADIERPAEQYRSRYGERLGEAQGLLKDAAPAGGAPAAAAVDPAAATPARSAAAAVDPAAAAPGGTAAHAPIDPTQFGAEGHGGAPDAEALALLQNKNIVLDANAVQDIKAGRIDPRVIGVLTKLSHDHKLTISCTCSDHAKFTTGGSVSNHHFGRGVDIAAVDGVPVNSSNFDAREIAMKLQDFDPSIRPNEIGSPWAIGGPGYFTDSGHQDHLHVGFKQAIDPGWKPPAEVAATGPAAAAAAGAAPAVGAPAVAAPGVAAPGVAAAAAAPGAPVAAAAPKPGASIAFAAVSPQDAAKAAAVAAGTAKPRSGASLAFMQAAQPQQPGAAAAAAAPGAVPPAGAAPPEAAGALAASAFAGGPDAYPGDNASKEQLAAWLAEQARKRGLPPELPVMASLVESGLKNLSSGDADSVGFFQMRVGIWNQGAYAGFPQDPAKQAAWFLDQAEAVKKQRIARGQSVTDPNQFGDWIADIERPAEQYRGRYQLRLGEAQGLLKSAQAAPAGAVAAAPAPAGAGAAVVDVAAAAGGEPAGPRALAAIAEAKKYLGTPYHWGGSTPQTGFDCSGLMQWAYAKAGITIPRVTYTQVDAANALKIDRSQLHPGDLIYFASNGTAGGDIHHVGMYIGEGKFLHAPQTGEVVKVSSLDEPYFKSQYYGARRFDTGAPALSAAGSAPAAGPAAAAAVPGAAAVPPAAPVAAAPPPVAPPAPAVDALEVAKAQAAAARDAAEVRRNGSILFKAVTAQEASKARATLQFMKAVDPSQQVKPAAAAAAPPPAAAAAPPAVAAPPEAAAPAPAASTPADVSAQSASRPADAGPAPDLSNVALGDYPGDNAPQADLAKWMAKQAEKAGLPPELPVMASLVESGVKNLNFGDADSVGFFQMRVGIWDRGPYAGFPQDPRLQVKWFIDNALAVKKQRLGNGKPIDDPGQYGDWIADVERPAAQYRYRYQLRLSEARRLLS